MHDVLVRAKFRRWISVDVAGEFVEGLAQDAVIVNDPPPLSGVSPDPDDDYLIALARAAGADCIVSGDRHLLDLEESDPPVLAPRRVLDALGA